MGKLTSSSKIHEIKCSMRLKRLLNDSFSADDSIHKLFSIAPYDYLKLRNFGKRSIAELLRIMADVIDGGIINSI
ncbi:MAG: hypothetical protein WCT77_03585 [Bacteroidota bacterium]